MPTLYRHTQLAPVPVAILAVVIAAGLWCAVRGQPACLAIPVLMSVVLLLFAALTVTVDDEAVVLAFGIGLIHRRIPLDRVRDANPVRNRWWYGWGIRWTPHGWLWNVAGFDAVELIYDDGGRFRIGSDEPDRLAGALRSAIGNRRRVGRDTVAGQTLPATPHWRSRWR